jgi:hypothetical protein
LHLSPQSMSLLIRPDEAPPGPDRHFGVADRLAQLPRGWLCVGQLRDIPAGTRYKAHSGDTWVWVTPANMKSLTDFSLIIQDIDRVGINSPTLFHSPPAYTPIVFETADTVNDPRHKITVQVAVDQGGQLVTSTPYFPLRLENLGTADLRGAIGAAGIASVPH